MTRKLHATAISDSDAGTWHSLPPHVPGTCYGAAGGPCPEAPDEPCQHGHRSSRTAHACSLSRPPFEAVTWRLDPIVWQVAVFRGYEAAIWWTGPGTQLGWIIHRVGGLDPVAQGTGQDEADAKVQAEAKLRELAS
jgi:hypothetical protein